MCSLNPTLIRLSLLCPTHLTRLEQMPVKLHLLGFVRGGATIAPTLTADGIRVGTTWGSTVVGEKAAVSFQSATGSVTEGSTTNATVVYTLNNTDGTATNNPAVSGTVAVTAGGTGSAADVSFTGTYSFPTGTASGATANVFVTAVDDSIFENSETVVFGLGTPAGGSVGTPSTYTLTITDPGFPVPVQRTLSNGRCYRLLSTPVTGVTVDALADGQSGTGHCRQRTGSPQEAQYPAGSPNFFVGYQVPGAPAGDVFTGYQRPAATASVLTPGRGFFWLLYDQDIQVSADGIRWGHKPELRPRDTPSDGDRPAADGNQTITFATNGTNTFHMGGNPFATAMTADGVTASQPDPERPPGVRPERRAIGYQVLPRTAATTLSPWQGFFIEQTTAGTDLS